MKSILILLAMTSPDFFYSDPLTGPRGGSPPGGISPTVAPSLPRGLRFEIDPQSVAAVDERYAVTIHTTSNCPPCERLKAALRDDARLSVTLAPLNQVPSGVPLSTFPFITFRDSDNTLRYNSTARTADAVVSLIERYTSKRRPAESLKEFASTYNGPHVGVQGMTVKWHLTNPPHGYTADQLAGLSESEMLAIHSADHYGQITPHEARSSNAVASRANGRTRAAKIHGSGVAKTALGKWRDNIGIGNKVTGSWSKSGSQNFDLLQLVRGKPWSARDIYGERGSFSFSAPTTNLIVKESSLDYRVVGDQVRFDVEFWIEASRLGITDVPQSVDSAQPVGFSPLMILSGLSMLWQLAHPEASVILPGTISVEGVMSEDGTLRVSFPKGKAPSVRVHILWEWMLGVQAVTVSETKVRLEFVPQPKNWLQVPGWTFDLVE